MATVMMNGFRLLNTVLYGWIAQALVRTAIHRMVACGAEEVGYFFHLALPCYVLPCRDDR
jgi:hypothetical protein